MFIVNRPEPASFGKAGELTDRDLPGTPYANFFETAGGGDPHAKGAVHGDPHAAR
jgi:hypothetical protein